MQFVDLIRIRPLDSNSVVGASYASYASGRSANRRDSGGEFPPLPNIHQALTLRSGCSPCAQTSRLACRLRSGNPPTLHPDDDLAVILNQLPLTYSSLSMILDR